jgi:phage-related protein
MAVEVGTGYVSITPSAKGFGSSLSKQIDGEVSSAGKAAGGKAGKGFLGGMGGALKVGVAAVGIGAIAGIGKKALDNARQSQQIANITEATIKATGGAANVTASQVQGLANELQRKTGIDDETIRTGQNMLLTFKNVANAAGEGNDVFNQASEAALNLSAAGFGSVESASVMLGKALNDPLKGMTALGRAGVTFTDAQKEQVKAAMANNDVLSAQKIILGEVEAQVGGVAEAAADPMAKINNLFADLLETLGTALMPALNALADAITPVFEALGEPLGEVANILGGVLADAVKALAPIFAPLAQHVARVAQLLGGALGRVIKALAPLIVALLDALMPLLDVVMVLIEPILELVSVLLEALMPIIMPLIQLVAILAKALASGLGWVIKTVIAPALMFVADLISSNVGPAMASLLGFFQPVVDWFNKTAMPVLTQAWQGLQIIVAGVVDWFQSYVAPVIQVAVNLIIGYYKFLWNAVKTVFSAIGKFIGANVQLVSNILGRIRGIVSNVIGFFRNLYSGSVERFQALVSFIGGIPGKIVSILSGLGSSLYNIGRNMIQGLINGAGSLLRNLGQFFLNMLPGWIVGPFKAALGIASPSKLFAHFGENIGDGLVQGIHARTRDVQVAMGQLTAATTGITTGNPLGSMSAPRIGAMSATVRPAAGLVIENLNVTSGPNERAEDSLPRALRRLAFVSGM